MRNPPGKRNWALAWMLVCIGIVILVIPIGGWWGKAGEIVQGIVWTLAGFAALTFFMLAWVAQVEAIRYRRLLRGMDELTRWRVSEGEWRAFVALDARLGGSLEPGAPAGCGGIEVVVGKRSVLVGDDFRCG